MNAAVPKPQPLRGVVRLAALMREEVAAKAHWPDAQVVTFDEENATETEPETSAK